MEYLVSVIIPVYNGEKYLNRCLTSVKEQVYRNIEAIVVDDGSIDNSFSIMNEFKEDKRFKVFTKENTGVSSTRNYGLTKAKGDYLLFLDSDDYLHKEAIGKLINKIDSKEVIVFCNNYEVYTKENYKRIMGFKEQNLNKDIVLKEILFGNAGLVCSKLFSRDVINKNNIKFNDGIKVGEDQLFFCEVALYSSNFKYINEFLYYYDRRNEVSATWKYQEKLIDNFILLNKEINKLIILSNFNIVKYEDLLNNKKLHFIWLSILNEDKKKCKNILAGIKLILKAAENFNLTDNFNNSYINRILYNAVNNNDKFIENIRVLIILKIFLFKMKIRKVFR